MAGWPNYSQPEFQPHDPQDYRDRNPLAPDPALRTWEEQPTDVLGALLKLLEAPPIAGNSRAVAAGLRGENPLRAAMSMGEGSPETFEELQGRGWHPAAAFAVEALIPDLLLGPMDVADTAATAARLAPAAGAAALPFLRRAVGNAADLDFDPVAILDLIRREGGASVNPRNPDAPSPTAGNFVGGLADEVRIPRESATPEDIANYVQANADQLGVEGRFVGGWVDGDDIVLDVSESHTLRDDALRAGQRRGEQAIFDAATGEVVSVPPSRDSLSPALREYATSTETPIYNRKTAGPRVMERVGRIEDTLDQALTSPEAMARLQEVVQRGAAARADEWYNVDDLRNVFTEALEGDAEAAEEMVRVVALFTAATSPNTPVTTNAKRAIELTYSAFRGMGLDDLENFLLADPEAVGAVYGQSLSGVLRSRASIRQAFETGMVNGQKIGTFHSNFLGNSAGVTVDTHNMAGLLNMAGMDYRTPAGRAAIANLLEFNDPGSYKAFEGLDSWADADPTQFRDFAYGKVSQGAEYGGFERVQQRLAEQLGMTAREFQAGLWVGLQGETGVRNSRPFSQLFIQVLDEGAARNNMTRNELIRAIQAGSLGLGALFTADQFAELMGDRGMYARFDDQGPGEETPQRDPLDILGAFM